MRKKDETTRERILDACWTIIRREGFSAATTKRIAREAGVAEGTIFNNFPDKAALLSALVLERAGDVRAIFGALHQSAGQGDFGKNLSTAIVRLIEFYERLNWVSAAMFLDAAVMIQVQKKLSEAERGPDRAHQAMEAYLKAEQDCGRVPAGLSTATLGAVILGAAHEHAFVCVVSGRKESPSVRREFADSVVATLFGNP